MSLPEPPGPLSVPSRFAGRGSVDQSGGTCAVGVPGAHGDLEKLCCSHVTKLNSGGTEKGRLR